MSVNNFAASGRRNNAPTGDWRDRLSKTEEGSPRKNLFNACVALRDHPELTGKLAYNEFAGCSWARGALPWNKQPNRPLTEFDDLKATEWLQSPDVRIMVGSGTAREAVQSVAYEARFHPVLEWLESLKWDDEERLNTWLTTYFGVPDTPLARAFGRKFLISAVGRVMKPGCKVDHVLILEGLQGTMKSKSLRALVGDDWFADQIADLGTKDSCQDLRSVWVIELSELSAIRPGEVEKVKAYISRQVDHYRPSYGRRSIDVPRQCVFIGTTNASEYLSDITGNRRYWPVTCTKLDSVAIARDRDQLWAEAFVAFHAGEAWWLKDNELRRAAEAEQEARRIVHPWEPIIANWLDNPVRHDKDGVPYPLDLESGRVTVAQILEHAIARPVERWTTADQMHVGRILGKLGWTKRHTNRGNFWLPPGNDVFTASDAENQPKGIHPDEVFTPGVHPESRGNGHAVEGVNTVNTSRAHVREGDLKFLETRVHGVHAWPDAPPLGAIEDGYRYIGGDPAQESSWEAVQ
jgi:putative DNA primase/helicase